MQPLAVASLLERTDDGARFAFVNGWQCRLFVLADDMVRVLLTPPDGLREPRTWMVAPSGTDVQWEGRDRLDVTMFPRLRFDLDEGDQIMLRTAALRVSVRLDPFGLEWSTPAGHCFATDRATHAYAFAQSGATRHYMVREAGDRYFGLGDKTGPIDKHGRRLRTLALDALGYNAETSDPLYKHWPYVIVREESGVVYGLFYDTFSTATFDLGCEHDNYHGFYRYCEIENGDLDYYLFVGPGIQDVVRKFAELTGRMAFGPRWSLGYANTAMGLTDAPNAQAQLSEFINRAAEHDVPISAFHFGSGYSSIGPRRYVFTWNRDKFPDPKALVDKFRSKNMRLVANIKPCLLDDHPAYAEVAAHGAFVAHATGKPSIGQFWDGKGAWIDFTHPEGVRWWKDGLRRQLLDYGILGWNDNNEYGIWDEDAASHGFGESIPIDRSRPLQPLLMTRATCEAQAERFPDERAFTVTRAGPPGIQRYAQTWSGDNTTSWDTLRWNIRMGLTMSLSGMFNTGHDVGGFFGSVPDQELLVRWVQNGVFSPRFIMNSWKAGGETNTPWLHLDSLPLIRAAIRFRYRLMPYLYTLYRRAAVFSEPILRPVFYDFEGDSRAFQESDDFMFGPQLLVANVVEPGQRERGVYLPEGIEAWYDFHSGACHPGGSEIVVPAPLDRIPLFAPAGAIIPMTGREVSPKLHDEPSRHLHVFPPRSGRSSFTLYEDDGLSLRYRDGEYAEVKFELDADPGQISLAARVTGRYPLPYKEIAVELPALEQRKLSLRSEGVALVAEPR
jgi:alpha-glucosidase